MNITIKNEEAGFSDKRLAVLIKKESSIITRVLSGGESMTKEIAPTDKVTVGQKAEWDDEQT